MTSVKELYNKWLDIFNSLDDSEYGREEKRRIKYFLNGIEETLKSLKMLHLLDEDKPSVSENPLNIGIICTEARKNLCVCGAFLKGYSWDDPNHYGCRICGNVKWKKINSSKPSWRKAETKVRVEADDEKGQIKVIRTDVKFMIDWVKEEVQVKTFDKVLLIDVNNRKLFMQKGKKLVEVDETNIEKFLRGFDDEKIVDVVISYYNKLEKYWKLPDRYYSGLKEFCIYFKYPHLTLLNTFGDRTFFNPTMHLSLVDETKTSPEKMLGVTNRVIRVMVEKHISLSDLPEIRLFIREFGVDNFFNALSIIHSYWRISGDLACIRILMREGYKIKDLKAYIERASEYQALSPHDTLQLLEDYVKMSKDMGVGYIKYPKSLRKVHDVRQRDYRVVISEEQTEMFKKRYEEKQYLVYGDKNFKIVLPKEPVDVTIEGQELGHCVASYVSRIVNGLSLIVFLRKAGEEDKPYITIELSDFNKVVQVEGKNRRKPNKEEKEFIRKWCKAKGLISTI